MTESRVISPHIVDRLNVGLKDDWFNRLKSLWSEKNCYFEFNVSSFWKIISNWIQIHVFVSPWLSKLLTNYTKTQDIQCNGSVNKCNNWSSIYIYSSLSLLQRNIHIHTHLFTWIGFLIRFFSTNVFYNKKKKTWYRPALYESCFILLPFLLCKIILGTLHLTFWILWWK